MGRRLGVLTLISIVALAGMAGRLPSPGMEAAGGNFVTLDLDRFPPGSVNRVRLADHGVRCPYGRGFYLVRDGDQVLALSWRDARGELVPWNPPENPGYFHTPMWGSTYDKTGRRLAGPSPRSLDRYPVRVAGRRILVDTSHVVMGNPGHEEQVVSVQGEGCWREPMMVTGRGVNLSATDSTALKDWLAAGEHYPRRVEVLAVAPVAGVPTAFYRYKEAGLCFTGYALLSWPNRGQGGISGLSRCRVGDQKEGVEVYQGRAILGKGRSYQLVYGLVADRRVPAVEVVGNRLGSVRVPVRNGFFLASGLLDKSPYYPEVRDVRLLDEKGRPQGPPDEMVPVADGVMVPQGVERAVRTLPRSEQPGVILGAERTYDGYLIIYRNGSRSFGEFRLAWRFGRWEWTGGGSTGMAWSGREPLEFTTSSFTELPPGWRGVVYGVVNDERVARVEAVLAGGRTRPVRVVDGAFYLGLTGDVEALRALDAAGRELFRKGL